MYFQLLNNQLMEFWEYFMISKENPKRCYGCWEKMNTGRDYIFSLINIFYLYFFFKSGGVTRPTQLSPNRGPLNSPVRKPTPTVVFDVPNDRDYCPLLHQTKMVYDQLLCDKQVRYKLNVCYIWLCYVMNKLVMIWCTTYHI